jgi:hypothetical protein
MGSLYRQVLTLQTKQLVDAMYLQSQCEGFCVYYIHIYSIAPAPYVHEHEEGGALAIITSSVTAIVVTQLLVVLKTVGEAQLHLHADNCSASLACPDCTKFCDWEMVVVYVVVWHVDYSPITLGP